MKKNIIAKIGAAAVVLTMVTTSLVGGTFAKYTSTVSGNATATVAAWKIDFKKGEAAYSGGDFALINQNTDALTENKTIAPGSNGTIVLDIDGTKSEVAYKYTIELDKSQLGDIPIKFYDKAGEGKTELTFTDNKYTLTGTVNINNDSNPVSKEVKSSIYWEWSSNGDDADNTLGNAITQATGKIGISMSAVQITEKETETGTP